ncbi:DUF2817 domain-containing protein [Nocardioidaceae bacterium]|nr:DUF2817 domain-containing protein [Nocardioidaceae bacterium]
MADSSRSALSVRCAPVAALALLTSLLLVAPGFASAAPAADPSRGAVPVSQADDEPPAAEPGSEPEARTFVRRKRLVGRSVQGRPIRAFYRGDPGADLVTMVIGSMHGNERAGESTARWMKRHTRPRRGTGVWIVPTMNPDGARAYTRQNARGVDLNRNWPTSGWTDASSSCCYGGPSRASEPETRAMRRFLLDVRPTSVASIHQPYRVVAANGKDPRLERRLARFLQLPLDEVGVGNPGGTLAPTMSSWYNDRVAEGTMVTVEYARSTSKAYRTSFAGRAVQRALRLGTQEQ